MWVIAKDVVLGGVQLSFLHQHIYHFHFLVTGCFRNSIHFPFVCVCVCTCGQCLCLSLRACVPCCPTVNATSIWEGEGGVRTTYLDKGHGKELGEILPSSPIAPPLDSPTSSFGCLVQHENPKQVGDDEWPEVLDGAEVEEEQERDRYCGEPKQDGGRLQPSLERHA